MMGVLGESICKNSKVMVPKPIDGFCSSHVISMTFMEGHSLSEIISSGTWTNSAKIFMQLQKSLAQLLASFGFQILELGMFHSDPHPGNILYNFEQIGLIDFGQVKILPDKTRALFAHLVLCMNEESDHLYEILKELQIEFTTSDKNLIRTIAFILFDTRMDIPEAKLSPLDSEFPPELRGVRISSIHTDVFMLIRVIAIFRGIFAALNIDLHARKIWAESARRAVCSSTYRYTFTRTAPALTSGGTFERLKILSGWLADRKLPSEREHILSFAQAKLFSIDDLKRAVKREDKKALMIAFVHFSREDRLRCIEYLSE